MARRIWLDITGVRPGSDAAVFAAWLAAAFRARADVDVTVCRRSPGLRLVTPGALSSLVDGRRRLRGGVAVTGLMRRVGRRLPERMRLATGRFVRLQRAALIAWGIAARGLLTPARRMVPVDRVSPKAGDDLLMLCPSGDAARFAEAGVRLVFLAVEAAALTRTDWLFPAEAAEAAVWLRLTLPHVSAVIAFGAATAQAVIRAGCLPEPALVAAAGTIGFAGPPARGADGARPFILAAGEIGEAGQTRHLLSAWRILLDEMPAGAVPVLVLAGPLGALVGDLLEQLRNSRLLDGHVNLVVDPRAEDIARLTRLCLFSLAIGWQGWGRATLDSLGAGVPCLSAFADVGAAHGAERVLAGDARGLAAAVRRWISTPPPDCVPPARDWGAVADDVIAALPA